MKLYVVSHKHFDLTIPDSYQPIYAGAVTCPASERRVDWVYDDSGREDISFKNSSFCELTALHWIWKNDTSDTTGLIHYRRYARNGDSSLPLSENEIETILTDHDCIVAQRSYLFGHNDNRLCSVAEQYRTIHSSTDLILVDRIIKRHFKMYYPAFKHCMTRNYLFPCNIIICRKELLNEYCRWLFSIESALEQCIDPFKNRDTYQERVFGFIAERLLNVFIEAHRLNIFEASVFDPAHPIEKPHYLFSIEDLRPKIIVKQPAKPPIAHGRNYSHVFDYRFYLEHNADLTHKEVPDQNTALWHFLEYGLQERRMAHPCFSIASYMIGHPKFKDLYGDNPHRYLEHYLDHPEDNAHCIGFENLLSPEEEPAKKHECLQGETRKTCLGKKIRVKSLERNLRRAEQLPVLD